MISITCRAEDIEVSKYETEVRIGGNVQRMYEHYSLVCLFVSPGKLSFFFGLGRTFLLHFLSWRTVFGVGLNVIQCSSLFNRPFSQQKNKLY